MSARRNAVGLWRCCTCRVYLPEEQFRIARDTGLPESYCRACDRARKRAWDRNAAMDDAWWERRLARTRGYPERNAPRAARREQAQRERAALARAMLARVLSWGLTRHDIRVITGMHWETARRFQTGPLREARVLEQLVVLAQVLEDVPRWERAPHKTAPGHPDRATIKQRYEALRAAHAD
jgi:hypothetical protein